MGRGREEEERGGGEEEEGLGNKDLQRVQGNVDHSVRGGGASRRKRRSSPEQEVPQPVCQQQPLQRHW